MKNTLKITLCGVFAALVFVFTFLFPIPNGLGGYINFGDGIIILAGAVLGGPLGALAGAVGSGLADLAAGYGVYAPATFIIKGIMGAIAGIFLYNKPVKLPKVIIASAICEAIMVVGYFIYECFLYGVSGAAAGLLPNGIQSVAAIIIAVVFIFALKKTRVTK